MEDSWEEHREALRSKSNREILLQLCASLDHVLLFSSINRKWLGQKRAILELIREGKRRAEKKR